MGSVTNPVAFPTFKAAAAIPAFRRVTITGNREVTLSANDELGHGISITPALATGDKVTVQLFTAGTAECGTDTLGTPLAGSPAYGGSAGLLTASAGSPVRAKVGTWTEGGAPGDSLEFIPLT